MRSVYAKERTLHRANNREANYVHDRVFHSENVFYERGKMAALFNVVDRSGVVKTSGLLYEEAQPLLDADVAASSRSLALSPSGTLDDATASVRRMFAVCDWSFGPSWEEVLKMRAAKVTTDDVLDLRALAALRREMTRVARRDAKREHRAMATEKEEEQREPERA
jgi:hypothetical protein